MRARRPDLQASPSASGRIRWEMPTAGRRIPEHPPRPHWRTRKRGYPRDRSGGGWRDRRSGIPSALTLRSGKVGSGGCGGGEGVTGFCWRRGAGPWMLSIPAGSSGGTGRCCTGTIGWLPGLSNVGSMTVRSGSSGSRREVISRGSLRGRMALASACLSRSQLA
jgi:hypothetical protein